jgi:hypothetical protein
MTKNIEDLLYRGDSLDKMGEMSGRLREDSRKYKKAAVKINWDAMLAKVSAFFIFAITLSYIIVGTTMFCFGLMPVGLMSATITVTMYALCASIIIILPVVMVIVMYITLLGWLVLLFCWLRVMKLAASIPAKLLLLQRQVYVHSFDGQIVMLSMQLTSTADDAALSVWKMLDDYYLYAEQVLENISLYLDSTDPSADYY